MCIKWRREDRDGQIEAYEKKRREARREGERQLEKIYPRAVKGKDIGVPRLAADEMDAAFDADPLEGVRTDRRKGRRRRCIDALGAAGGPMGDHAGPSPPVGVRAEWWQGGAKPVGGGVARPTPRRGLDRRGARCAIRVSQRSCGKREQRDRARCAPLVQGIYRAKMYAFLSIRSFPSFLLVSFRLLFFFWEFVLEELF